jgi:acetyl esterase/lipase
VVKSLHRRSVFRAVLVSALAAGTSLLVACGSSPRATDTVSATAQTSSMAAAVPEEMVADYLSGLAAHLRFPTADGPAPLIVLVPGGGWSSADPTGLIPLAELLTDAGSTTSLITYSTTGEGSTFPEAVNDTACAVRWSARQASSRGHTPTRVVLLGHSAGGHLAALVTLSGEEFGRECPDPPVDVKGLIGLAGIYDTDPFRSFMSPWMGISATEQSEEWARVNPLEWLRRGTDIPTGLRVLLIHGDADQSVPLAQTTAFAEALSTAKVETDTTVLPGLGHLEIFQAAHAGSPILAWMSAWPPQEASPTS